MNERVECPHCRVTIANVGYLPGHIRKNHKREWRDCWLREVGPGVERVITVEVPVEVKVPVERIVERVYVPEPECWNVVAPKGSDDAVLAAYCAVLEAQPTLDGIELSRAIAARVPGARVGPLCT